MAEETWWFHLNKEHGAYNGIEANLETKFGETRPQNILSVNTKVDNKESVVKLVAEEGWYLSAAADFIRTSPALIAAYTPEDHDAVVVMVTDVIWTGVV